MFFAPTSVAVTVPSSCGYFHYCAHCKSYASQRHDEHPHYIEREDQDCQHCEQDEHPSEPHLQSRSLAITRGRHGDRASVCERKPVRENQRMSMRIDLEVLSSFDFIITTSTSDSECVRV